MKRLIFPFLLILAFAACDQVDYPYPEGQGLSFTLDDGIEYIIDANLNISAGDTNFLKNLFSNYSWDTITAPDNSNKRFVVVEEFTGHTCLNCPIGSWEIVRLKDIYKEQLIPVSIHSGYFARPKSSGEKYRTDYRVKGGHGETYSTTFNIVAYPSAMVSRINNAEVTTNAQWENRINSIKDEAPKVKIDLKNYVVTNNSLDSIIRVQIDIEWLEDLNDKYNLQVFLTEDNVIDWQDSSGTDIEFYKHRHMLRKVVNGTFGLELDSTTTGKKASYQYITTVEEGWKLEEMEAVVYIFRQSPSYEIIQGNAASLR